MVLKEFIQILFLLFHYNTFFFFFSIVIRDNKENNTKPKKGFETKMKNKKNEFENQMNLMKMTFLQMKL